MSVTAVVMGKHLDKHEKDAARNVGTLPVRLGHRAGLLLMGTWWVRTSGGWFLFGLVLALLNAGRFLDRAASSGHGIMKPVGIRGLE